MFSLKSVGIDIGSSTSHLIFSHITLRRQGASLSGKFKVTTQIQDRQVRVTGKSRDELQAVMAAVRVKDFPVSVQFQNFRD